MRITIMITKGSLRKHPFLLALRRALGTSRAAAAKSEEKRMFSRVHQREISLELLEVDIGA